jgi:molybdopterin molybdotransferase
MIPVEHALQTILSTVSELPTEQAALVDSLGRVLAEPVLASDNLPPFDNSAMDGFVVRVADLQAASREHPAILPIAGEVAAGHAPTSVLAPGTAMRIMTGAMLPLGAEAVVKVEDTEASDGRVAFFRAAEPDDHIRRAGEDVRQGDQVLDLGMVLTPWRIQMAAAVGRPQLKVVRPARVAILATGDELVEPGEPIGPGQIRNSNAYALYAQILACGAVPIRLPTIPDTREATREAIELALSQADAIVSSGGVSMGEFDYVGETVGRLGTVHFTAIAQQPGKPFTYATVGGKPYFGLPGNPVSTSQSFELYVRPALRRMMGHRALMRPTVRARLVTGTKSPEGKRSFLRATVSPTSDGYEAHLTGPQGSGIIHSLVRANALVAIPETTTRVAAGETIEAILIEQPEV